MINYVSKAYRVLQTIWRRLCGDIFCQEALQEISKSWESWSISDMSSAASSPVTDEERWGWTQWHWQSPSPVKEKAAVGEVRSVKYSGNGSWLKWIACLRGDRVFHENVDFELLSLSLMFVQSIWTAESVNKTVTDHTLQGMQKFAQE